MHISAVQIENYKGVVKSGPVALSPGLNIFTGANNSGKTAILECIALAFSCKPHRSLSKPTSERSSVRVDVDLSGSELATLLRNSRSAAMVLPVPTRDSLVAKLLQLDPISPESLDRYWIWLEEHPRLTFALETGRRTDDEQLPALFSDAHYPPLLTLGETWTQGQGRWMSCSPSYGGTFRVQPAHGTLNECDLIARALRRSIYFFRANRLVPGSSESGPNRSLSSDAKNLAEVLGVIQANKFLFEEFNQDVRRVFPEVRWVSTRPVSSSAVEILVWFHDPASKREDLAIPLEECGTGLKEALAMLFLIFASTSRIIVIDEPNSFLHPGATRKLVEVFGEHLNHQYMISTHSATVITASNPKRLILVRAQSGQTELVPLDPRESNHLRLCLRAIGASLADVFGADNILWVEGQTEELCYPRILRSLSATQLNGTVILGVRSTGEFEGRHADAVLDIYSRVSGSSSLLPPALGFIFDSELRTDGQKADLVRRASASTGGSAHVWFTNCRMYENYLLHPAAIAAVLNSDDVGKVIDYEEGRVRDLLMTKFKDHTYFKGVDPEKWASNPGAWVNAPELLRDMFSELTEQRVQVFDKTDHAVRLTEWLLDHDSTRLAELAQLLREALQDKLEKLGTDGT